MDDLFCYGIKIHPDKQIVKDAIQEVFVRIIEKQKSLKVTDKVKVYLFKSLRNQILEELRTKNRKHTIETLIGKAESTSSKDVEEEFMSLEEHKIREKILDLALQSLTEHQREALFLRYSLDHTYNEISGIMGIDIPSARTLIYRSVKQVRLFILENSLSKITNQD